MLEQVTTFPARVRYGKHVNFATEDYWLIANAFYLRNKHIKLTVLEAFEVINDYLHILPTHMAIHKQLKALKVDIIHGRRH